MKEQAPEASPANSETPTALSFAEFLEGVPPNQASYVSDLAKLGPVGGADFIFNTPQIQLHCPDDECNGPRFFRHVSTEKPLHRKIWQFTHLYYRCSNCRRREKTFSIATSKDAEGYAGQCYKLGEFPPFGPPTPARLIKLIGPDRELFLKGRRCEDQGLGIGAFVYYRRVVENQKDRIISEILKVARRLEIDAAGIAELEAAVEETQFSKALESVKHGIPPSLLINGHNPLLLLHSALSRGLHGRDDQECLEIATSVRVILMELSERLAQALKDEAELSHALSKLLSIKDKRG